MIRGFFMIFLLATTSLFHKSSAFWSLDTDLQFGYEIYDRSYEINAVIQAIISASSRNYVVQTDSVTRSALVALSSIATQLRTAPGIFFNELAYAASSRTNNEAWHIERLRKNHQSFIIQLEILSNSTGPLQHLSDITNPTIMQTIRTSLKRIHESSHKILKAVEGVTFNVALARANSSLLLTPKLLNDFIESDESGKLLQSSLVQVRNSFLTFLLTIRDATRLTAAHGSMYELLDRSQKKDSQTRNNSLYNFENSYNRVRNTLLTAIISYRQTAQTGFTNFIQRVQANYDDTIVRPRFEREQLPLILAFADVVIAKVYNQSFFENAFDGMRDGILEAYSNDTNDVFKEDSQYRSRILSLLRRSYARNYSLCLNELISEVQVELNSLTGKYSFCLDERTSSITVVIPSTNSWLSVIRDNVNFILQQLNACLNGQSSVAGRTATSDCIQSNANNLQFYAMYLPMTVEANLRPVVASPPLIFKSCIGGIKAVLHYRSFDEVYQRCNSDEIPIVTTPTTTTTEEWTTTTTEEWTTTTSTEMPTTTEEESTTATEEWTTTEEETTDEQTMTIQKEETTETSSSSVDKTTFTSIYEN